MRVALLSYGAEGLGLQYLSSFLKKHRHRVKLFYDPCLFDDKLLLHYPALNKAFSFKNWILKNVISYNPDIVGISVLTDTFRWASSYARGIKELLPNTKIIGGGTHVTILPERVSQEGCFDYLIRGEGEVPMAELANALDKNMERTDIKGVWSINNGRVIKNDIANLIEDLTFYGTPDRSIYEPYINTKKTLLAISSRGCVYACSYCHHNALRKIYKGKGKYLRRLNPGQFINYLKEAFDKYKYESLQIYDEIFTYDTEWLKEFSELYRKEIGVPYICLGHPNFMSEDVIRALKDSNCFCIQIGVQSLRSDTRSRFLSRSEEDSTIKNMIELLEGYRLPYQLDMIFGLPEEGEETYLEAVKYFSNCKSASKINTLILSLQPQTDMVDQAIEAGIICEDDRMSIDAGREGCRVGEPGSIRSKEQLKMFNTYMLMDKIAVKLPKCVTIFLLKTRIYKILRFFEPFLGHILRLWRVDKRDILYIDHYIRYIAVFILKKLRVK